MTTPPPDENQPVESEQERDDAVIGQALRYSMFAAGGIGLIALIAVIYIWWSRPPIAPVAAPVAPELPQVRDVAEIALPQIPFTDITAAAGIDFIHENGAYGDKLLPETMGGGCAFLDFDSDGDPDILFVNSRRWPWDPRPAPETPATLALYENDGTGNFQNVTAEAGLDVSLYGQGCAVGDYDNDGDPDLFISACALNESPVSIAMQQYGDIFSDRIGPHFLFRNDSGRFVNASDKLQGVDAGDGLNLAGEAGDWGTSCGWFDFDNDADLDLWVCRYVEWSKEFDLAQDFRLTGDKRAYGRPQNFTGTSPLLYRNDGADGFTEVSEDAGLQITTRETGAPMGKSLGVTFADFDGDGLLDVVVANDTVQNFLFHNTGGGEFTEAAALSGVAFDMAGNARGAMGIDSGCPRNGDDCFAVAIGNFANEMSAFYVNLPGSLQFSDEAISNGLGPNTRLSLTFGVFFLDADLDGRLDYFQANGHLEEEIALVQASQTYAQPPQLFWNAGADQLTEFVPLGVEECGVDLLKPIVGRGSAYADIDADGDLDLLIAATGQKPRLLRNDQSLGRHWLRLKLIGNATSSNRDAIGARVDLYGDGTRQTRLVTPTRGYLSQSESIVTFGLGDAETFDRIDITWPDGALQTIEDLELDRLHEIVQQ